MRVSPTQEESSTAFRNVAARNARRWLSLTPVHAAGFVFDWILWCFLMLLMLSQLLTSVRNTTASSLVVVYGQEPSRGLYKIPGNNDEPYSYRLVACVRRGRTHKAVSLNDALSSESTVVEDSTGAAIHGYRVITRTGFDLSDNSKQAWTRTCRLLNSTLDGIYRACEALGYTNLTRDSLHIMNGLESRTLKIIPNALPVLIMPYWDNDLSARYAISSWDGNACVFKLQGRYEDPLRVHMFMVATSRVDRETQTMAFLGRFGGIWKNGWYEDTQGTRWYSDILAKDPHNEYGVHGHFFDPSTEQELVCNFGSECAMNIIKVSWGGTLTSVRALYGVTSLLISNGARFGIFYFRSAGVTIVSCVYDFASLVSNASVVLLLVRWMFAMLALHRGFVRASVIGIVLAWEVSPAQPISRICQS